MFTRNYLSYFVFEVILAFHYIHCMDHYAQFKDVTHELTTISTTTEDASDNPKPTDFTIRVDEKALFIDEDLIKALIPLIKKELNLSIEETDTNLVIQDSNVYKKINTLIAGLASLNQLIKNSCNHANCKHDNTLELKEDIVATLHELENKYPDEIQELVYILLTASEHYQVNKFSRIRVNKNDILTTFNNKFNIKPIKRNACMTFTSMSIIEILAILLLAASAKNCVSDSDGKSCATFSLSSLVILVAFATEIMLANFVYKTTKKSKRTLKIWNHGLIADKAKENLYKVNTADF